MLIECWVTKATNTSAEYVIIIAFRQQQWLQERFAMLRRYVHCLSPSKLNLCWSRPYAWHDGVLVSEGVFLIVPNIGIRMKSVTIFVPRVFYPQWKRPSCSLATRLGGPHVWLWRREKTLPEQGIQPRFACLAVRSLVVVSEEVYWLTQGNS